MILYCLPNADGFGVTLKATVNTFPKPETLLAPQSKVREPLEIFFACPGLQEPFDPSMVNTFGATR